MKVGISSIFARILRWGKPLEPVWVFGPITTQPLGGATLVDYSIPQGYRGYIYGFMITATEPNMFTISWVSGGDIRDILINFGGSGSVKDVSPIPININYPVDGGEYIHIYVNYDGSSGSIYQAGLLVGLEKK